MSRFRRISINQATIKHASLATAITACNASGIESIGLWREPVAEVGLDEAVRLVADSGLRVSSYCRGGFLTSLDIRDRQRALDDNFRAIEETAALAAVGAPGSASVLVLVAGGLDPTSKDLAGARAMFEEGLTRLEVAASAAGVTLAIEPLHPMYASDRAVVSTLGQALDLAENFAPDVVGVVIDAFHVWWDPDLSAQIDRAGRGNRIACYQVCDWSTPLGHDVLLSRHYPGDGVIDLRSLTRSVRSAGFAGDIEIEIFNEVVWNDDPKRVIERALVGIHHSVDSNML